MQQLQPGATLQGGKYRIDRVLGQGGFGNTYVGYNTEFEETIAIKEFFMRGVTERDDTTGTVSVSNAENVPQFEEQREKFKKEARRLRKLKNDHIVKVHDLFEENGTAYYVMDYIDGESLAERMKHNNIPFSEAEVRSILPQVLGALKEVHDNQIWHLDLKPGNIMMDKGGTVYLIDFGASKQIRANGSMTTSTALCYTPGYAPNEQTGQMYDRFGPWTDIYALGATIYNLLTNEKPPMSIDIEEDEEDAFSFSDDTSEGMRSLVEWMMQPKRKKRPQSVDEIMAQVTEAETPAPTETFEQDSTETVLATPATEPDDAEIEESVETVLTPESVETVLSEPDESEAPESVETVLSENSEPRESSAIAGAIDLGISVLWANCNLGENDGSYTRQLYGWGDATGKKISKRTDDYLELEEGIYLNTPQNISGTKYDIATAMWGKRWRMPERAHWEELIKKCRWTRETCCGQEGYRVEGPNGNSIFLPFTGLRNGYDVTNLDAGYYWTSELADDDWAHAYYFYCDTEKYSQDVISQDNVSTGRAIRPICDS